MEKMKTLDLTPAIWMQQKEEIKKRNENALLYSEKVRLKRERKDKAKKLRMKRLYKGILSAIAISSIAFQFVPKTTNAMVAADKNNLVDIQNLRVDTAVYYDYLTLVTSDGNEWFLDDTEEKVSYIDGDRFYVTFDTLGTDDITDDVIINMQFIK